MKRFFACILIAFMILPTVVACSKDKNENETADSTFETSGSVADESKNTDDSNDDEIESDEQDGEDNSVELFDTVAGKTPLEAYKQAFAKINSMVAYELEINTEYEYVYQGTTDDTSSTSLVYSTDGVTAHYSVDYNGYEKLEYRYVGNVMYKINADGSKEKKSLSKEEYLNTYAITKDDFVIALEDSLFGDKKFEKTEDVYYVSVDTTSAACAAFIGLSKSRDAVCKIGFDKDGNIVSISVSATCEASAGITIDITKTVTFSKIGGVAAISAPEDADSYQTVS